MRTDEAIARLTANVAAIAGKTKATGESYGRDDFMPYLDKPEEVEASPEDVQKLLTGKKN